jgi:hypothetical protein
MQGDRGGALANKNNSDSITSQHVYFSKRSIYIIYRPVARYTDLHRFDCKSAQLLEILRTVREG